MVERQELLKHEREPLEIVKGLPRLTPEEESRLIRVCEKGSLEPFDAKKFLPPFFGPPYIEVTGMPGTGKTTLSKAVAEDLKNRDMDIHLIAERDVPFDKGGRFDDVTRYHYALTMFYRTAEAFLTYYYHEQDGPKSILFDRGFYNAIAFLEAHQLFWEPSDFRFKKTYYEHILEMRKKLPISYMPRLKGHVKIAAKFIDRFHGDFLNAIIICQASVDHSLEYGGGGRVVSPEFLPFLQQAFKNLPYRIADLRRERRKIEPLLIIELNADQEWETHKDLFLKSIGSVFYHFATRFY